MIQKYSAIFFERVNGELKTFSQNIYANTKKEAHKLAQLEAKQKDLRLIEVRA